MADILYSQTKDFSEVGSITLYSDGTYLVGLTMPSQQYTLPADTLKIEEASLPIFDETFAWLSAYFKGHIPKELPPIRFIGTDFRQSVWQALCQIPAGSLITYGDLAKKLYPQDNNMGIRARAIGGAVGHNPIPIIVPCHRVIGSNRNLTGYTGGLAVKVKLLELEGIDVSQLKWPKRTTKNTV